MARTSQHLLKLFSHLHLLPLHYNFYEWKSENSTSNRPGPSHTPRFVFWIKKQVSATSQARYRSQVHAELHTLGGKTGTCNRPGLSTPHASYFGWENRYLRPAMLKIHSRSQVHAGLHILDRKTGTRNRAGLRYIHVCLIYLLHKLTDSGQRYIHAALYI